jgi:hypothetical protein
MRELEAIPANRHMAVAHALRTAFGTKAASNFRPLKGGISGAHILLFDVGNRSCVLRIEPDSITLDDRQRHYDCMSEASTVGAAPFVHYADAASGVAIIDYIRGRRFSEHPSGAEAITKALGALLARVQETPLFPAIDYLDLIDRLLGIVKDSEFLAPGLVRRYAEGFARIRNGLPWNPASFVSCHNDPNPRNILFDGERAWLVDWELAFRNDPLVDVAIVLTNLPEIPGVDDALFEATFGFKLNAPVRARLGVIRLLARLFYGCIVVAGLGGKVQPDAYRDIDLSPAQFQRAIADGRLGSGTPETAYAFAKMSLATFVAGISTPEFDEMLRISNQG